MTQWNRLFLTVAATAVIAGSSCVNIFDPIDNPSGDAQLLSAGRAAFDRGDVANARDHYSKVSSEAGKADLVFVDLDGCGADIGAFAKALSEGTKAGATPGIMMSIMAEKMNSRVGTSCFATLLAAYKSAQTITEPALKGFTSFLAALAIAGEVLGSNNGINGGTLDRADLYGTPATCNITSLCAGCVKADGISAALAVDLNAATTITANWGTLKGAMTAALANLTLMGIDSGPSDTLATELTTNPLADSNNNQNYRCILSGIGVGR